MSCGERVTGGGLGVRATATAAFAFGLGFGFCVAAGRGTAARVVRAGVRGAGADVTAALAGLVVRCTGFGGRSVFAAAVFVVVAASGGSGVGASGVGVVAAEGAVVVDDALVGFGVALALGAVVVSAVVGVATARAGLTA